ncbi:MAG: helix-turn-helix transcriptional regulator [Pseudomonadota bacterium]
MKASPSFGDLLRFWRRKHKFSQLDLAHRAGTTPRHISFVETGCSRPRRDLVVRLAEGLDIPIRERNHLFIAAGLRPEYGEYGLHKEQLEVYRDAIEGVLAKHDPFTHNPARAAFFKQRLAQWRDDQPSPAGR